MIYLFCLLVTLTSCEPNQADNNTPLHADTTSSGNLELTNPKFQKVMQLETAGMGDAIMTKDTLTYLALGDSYTIGESVRVESRWPVQLASMINTKDSDYHIVDPMIIAETGWTTSNLSNAMDNLKIDTTEFDLVSLLIGVNNQFQGLSLEKYKEEYEVLLDRAIALTGGNPSHVFVLSIPDYGYTPYGSTNQMGISQELMLFNEACRSITLSKGVSHCNITPISQQWPAIDKLIASDNLHPSGFQYQLWVESFFEQVISNELN